MRHELPIAPRSNLITEGIEGKFRELMRERRTPQDPGYGRKRPSVVHIIKSIGGEPRFVGEIQREGYRIIDRRRHLMDEFKNNYGRKPKPVRGAFSLPRSYSNYRIPAKYKYA
ncbi:MAG: hypothetical protein ABH863_05365 [Candidatus Micrarchaeota archaeon]